MLLTEEYVYIKKGGLYKGDEKGYIDGWGSVDFGTPTRNTCKGLTAHSGARLICTEGRRAGVPFQDQGTRSNPLCTFQRQRPPPARGCLVAV